MAVTIAEVHEARWFGEKMKMAIVTLTPDDSWLAAGEALDLLTPKIFTTLCWGGMQIGSVSVGKSAIKFGVVSAGADGTTALTTSNVLLVAHREAGAGAGPVDFLAPVDTTNLSSYVTTWMLFGY